MKHPISKLIADLGGLPAHYNYRDCVVVNGATCWFVMASPHVNFPRGLQAKTRHKLLFLIDRALDAQKD